MRRTIVSPKISHMIGECHLTRNVAVRVLAGLYGELPQQYARYKVLRTPEDSTRFFDRRWRYDAHVTFHVDDSTSPDHLFVVDFEHQSRLRPG